MEVLSVKGLRKTFRSGVLSKKTEVLKGIDFSVEAGKTTGFLGANGAGKTTSIKCVLNLIFPDDAEISYFGEKELTSEVKRRIGFLPERPYFYDYLTGFEFLKFYGQISTPLTQHELDQRIDQLLHRVNLVHARDRALRDYSKGMLQRVGVAQALIGDPDFVILDEPMSGLDPDGRHEVSEIIKETAHEGTAVFFSSHLLHDVERLCENLVVLKHGQLVYQGNTAGMVEKVEADYEIVYLESGREKSETAIAADQVNQRIDQLRSLQKEIVAVKKHNQSLEKAFVKIAMRDQ